MLWPAYCCEFIQLNGTDLSERFFKSTTISDVGTGLHKKERIEENVKWRNMPSSGLYYLPWGSWGLIMSRFSTATPFFQLFIFFLVFFLVRLQCLTSSRNRSFLLTIKPRLSGSFFLFSSIKLKLIGRN